MPETTIHVESDVDLFSPEHVADPYPTYDRLRERSAAVYMRTHGFWLLTRYTEVRAATLDWETFSSADGVGLDPELSSQHVGSVLGSDPPEHDLLRAVLSEKLAPRGLAKLRAEISASAAQIASQLISRRRFDAVSDLARKYPIDVLADLLGLPYEGRETLQPGADAVFAFFGPPTQYLQDHTAQLLAYFERIMTMTDRQALAPGKWGAFLMDAVDAGRITSEQAFQTLGAYMVAGMDTTVNAIGALFDVFAKHPDVWDAVRADPSRKAAVFEEILRLESPVQGFFRMTTRDVTIDDVHIPARARVMLHWGAANRDPRHYPDAGCFDINRNPVDHLAFGYGVHGCAGQGLARMEVHTLLDAFVDRVRRFHPTGDTVRHYHPIVRGLESVPVEIEIDDN